MIVFVNQAQNVELVVNAVLILVHFFLLFPLSDLHVSALKELVPHGEHLVRVEYLSGYLQLLVLSQRIVLLSQVAEFIPFAILLFVEEGCGATDVLTFDDIGLEVWLDLNDQKLFIADVPVVHLIGIVLEHIVQVFPVEALVEFLVKGVLSHVFIVVVIVPVFVLPLVFLLQRFFLSLPLLVLLVLVQRRHSLQVIRLLPGELDDSSEPLASEHKLIPKSDSLHRVELVKPKFKLLLLTQALSPHLLQHFENPVVLFVTPSLSFDCLEFEWVFTVLRFANVCDHTVVVDLLLHVFCDRSFNLGNK